MRIRLTTILVAAVLGTGVARAAPPPPVEDYGKLPAMELVRLSPSGQRYAFIAKVGETRRLIVATADNKPVEADDLGQMKVWDIEWAGDDHLLIRNSATVFLGMDFTVNKDELDGVIAVDLKHHKSFSVFGSPYEKQVAHTVTGAYGTSQIDGRWYGYFGAYTYDYDKGGGTLRADEDGRLLTDLWRVDLDTGELHIAAKSTEQTDGWVVAPQGEVVARLFYNQKRGDWRVMSGKWNGVRLAEGVSPHQSIALEGLGRTPDSLLLKVGGHDKNEMREIRFNATGLVNTDAETLASGESYLFDPVTRLWIGTQDSEDPSLDHLFDPAAQARLAAAVKALPGYVVHLVSFTSDFNRLIVRTDGGDDSGTYWLVDIAKGAATVLGEEYPTIVQSQVGPTQLVQYKAADGLSVEGVLTLPPGRTAKGLPLVVMPHGGPEAYDRIGFDYWAQAFASRGYAVFQPNFRGSSGYGNAFRDAGFGQWGRKMQTDISDGVAELARRGIIDPKRACIVGASYGGYAALAGVTLQHGLYRCAVSVGGVSDPAAMLTSARERADFGSDSTTRYWKAFMGVTTTWETELNAISPRRQASQADAPVLLIHGKDDTVVEIEQSQAMERALRSAGKPVELITLAGADHWFKHEDARIAMVKASVEFVLKHNPPDAAPVVTGPAK